MRDLEIRCASNVPSGYQQVPMSGDSNYVITGGWAVMQPSCSGLYWHCH
jgi:hypothetical protein